MRSTILLGLLAAPPLAHAGPPRVLDGLAETERRTTPEAAVPHGRRAAPSGAGCGPSAGNAVCAAGLCCSETGTCGVGTAFCGAPGCQLSYGPECDGNKTPTGKDTSSVPRPLFGSVPYGVDISHCTVSGKVALTFDDGPYIYTNDLLDVLKNNNVTATFFITGSNGGKGQIQDPSTGYPAIVQRMHADGHQIGSHTWSHQDLSTLTAQQRHDQIVKNEIAIMDILGFFPTYFRPPYTRWNADALADLNALGYHVINYDIDTRDWQGDYTYAQNTYSTILAQHNPSASSWVSLAHDIEDKTVHGFAQYMIDQARKLGYQLVTVGECLGDARINWYRDPSSGQPFVAVKQVAQQPSSTTSTILAPKTSTQSTSSSTTSKGTTTQATSSSTTLKGTTTSPSPFPIITTATPVASSTASPSYSSVGPGSTTLPHLLSSSSSSSFPGSSTSTSLSTIVTPTPVATPNFGAGTGNTTGIVTSMAPTSPISTPTAATTTKSSSAAGRVATDSVLGLVLGLFAFVFFN